VLIVGQGLAGSALALTLLEKGADVTVVDRGDSWSATRQAAGLVTTLAGKGMNPAWRQEEYLAVARYWYEALEVESGAALFYELPVVRLFDDAKQAEKFQRKLEQSPDLYEWVDNELETDALPIQAKDGTFVMAQSGRLDTVEYLRVVREKLEREAEFLEQDFEIDSVEWSDDGLSWNGEDYDALILCQGFFGLGSGAFESVPHRSAKGEMLALKLPNLPEDVIFNRNGWIVPQGDGVFRAGATYSWDDLNGETSEEGREAVLEKVKGIVNEEALGGMEVLDHGAGVRPIINRSQPLIGLHPENPRLGFFNGLGSKGVITAPAVSQHFADVLFGEDQLDPELDLRRMIQGGGDA